MYRFCLGMVAVVAASVAVSPAFAAANLVTNGSFEQTTGSLSSNNSSVSGQVSSTDLPGWSVAGTNRGLDVLYTPNTADSSGAPAGGNGTVRLWGPNGGATGNSSNNGLTSTSPDGGNFVGADGDPYYSGPLQQTVNGLAAGTNYLLTFYYAGAQEAGNGGATTEAWNVSFGAQTLNSATVSTANHGFSGWKTASLLFTATSGSQLLSFLAVGTPSGVPPFALLDGVSLTAAPEPASWTLMVAGLVGAGWLVRRRRRSSRSFA